MTYAEMIERYKTLTGRTAFITMQHSAGPSLADRFPNGPTFGVVIPIDDKSRIGVAEALAEDAEKQKDMRWIR